MSTEVSQDTSQEKAPEEKKKTIVHYTDVLTLISGKLLCLDGMDGVYRTMDILAGPGVTTLAILHLSKPLEKHLRALFPTFSTEEVESAIETATLAAKTLIVTTREEKISIEALRVQLDKYVLPLIGKENEFVEIEHIGEEEQKKLLETYPDFLQTTIGKKIEEGRVIVVQMDKDIEEAVEQITELLDKKEQEEKEKNKQ